MTAAIKARKVRHLLILGGRGGGGRGVLAISHVLLLAFCGLDWLFHLLFLSFLVAHIGPGTPQRLFVTCPAQLSQHDYKIISIQRNGTSYLALCYLAYSKPKLLVLVVQPGREHSFKMRDRIYTSAWPLAIPEEAFPPPAWNKKICRFT